MRSFATTTLVALVLTASALAGTGVRSELTTFVTKARAMAVQLGHCAKKPQNDRTACAEVAEENGPALQAAIGNPGMIRIAYDLTQTGTHACRARAQKLQASAIAASNAISDSTNGIMRVPYGAPASAFHRAARRLRTSATYAVRYSQHCLR